PGGIFLLAALVSTSSPPATAGLLCSTRSGVTCHPPPHAKHGPVLTFTAPHRPPPRPYRIAFATNREHKGQQIGSASPRGSAAHVIHGDFPQNPLSRVNEFYRDISPVYEESRYH